MDVNERRPLSLGVGLRGGNTASLNRNENCTTAARNRGAAGVSAPCDHEGVTFRGKRNTREEVGYPMPVPKTIPVWMGAARASLRRAADKPTAGSTAGAT